MEVYSLQCIKKKKKKKKKKNIKAGNKCEWFIYFVVRDLNHKRKIDTSPVDYCT